MEELGVLRLARRAPLYVLGVEASARANGRVLRSLWWEPGRVFYHALSFVFLSAVVVLLGANVVRAWRRLRDRA